jgi:hypothetical protein
MGIMKVLNWKQTGNWGRKGKDTMPSEYIEISEGRKVVTFVKYPYKRQFVGKNLSIFQPSIKIPTWRVTDHAVPVTVLKHFDCMEDAAKYAFELSQSN